jgi:prolyl-tRNA editing enzyme YbaK/EbsC (Cys-tRNA(Pro) deacylase)
LESFSPRDNVLFELGYFLQAFGRKRTAIVQIHDKLGTTARVPTDLAGLTAIQFQDGMSAENRSQIRNWAFRFRKSFRSIHPAVAAINRILSDEYLGVDPSWEEPIAELLLRPFLASARAAFRGELHLTPGQYYSRLETEIASVSDNTEVLAVSTISSSVWSSDRDQQNYFARNIDAAARGASIRRLFVLPRNFTGALERVIRLQNQAGIEVRVAGDEHAAYFSTLEDIVLFVDSDPHNLRGYIALPAFDNPGRIRGGRLLFDQNECQHQREVFEAAWAYAATAHEIRARNHTAKTVPPGEHMRPAWVERQVFSCEEAAVARNVPLRNELKTLILETSAGLVAAHLRGDNEMSLRSVKDVLETEQARLAAPETLRERGLGPGTVCAVLEPVWSLPHLIDRAVMALKFVTTNNKTTTGYFRFDPQILLSAPSITLADISTG